MKRVPLNRHSELPRSSSLKRGKPKRSGFTPTSKEQREKVKGAQCLGCGDCDVFGGARIDPAHLCARAHGGCDDPLCVVPLCRRCHREFDDGDLDLLPDLVQVYVPELAHALEHYNGDLIALLQRLTGTRWVPQEDVAA